MNGSDKWFRWSFNIFIFLMCFQFGMLLFLKSLFYRAERRLKDNQAQVSFRCEDFFTDASYWTLPSSHLSLEGPCLDSFCPDSLWTSSTDQDVDLHVLSIKKAQPSLRKQGEVELGHFVNVKVAASDRPQVLTLISQNLMQWNLEISDKSQLKEVLIIGPEMVWVEGLPKDLPLTYFSPEQICSYPTAWEEPQNPDNQFRRLYLALKEYTGLAVTSFQGKEVARQMKVPFKSPLMEERQQRQPSSVASQAKSQPQRRDFLSLGLQWERDQHQLSAKSFHFIHQGKRKRVSVPQKAQAAHFDESTKKLYVINNFQFGEWDWRNQRFQALHMPLSMASMRWPTLMTANMDTGEILIYNEDKGGEIIAYHPKSQKWRRWQQPIGYSVIALDYLPKDQSLIGARLEQKKIGKLLKISSQGEVINEVSLEKGFEFLKSLWRAEIISDKKEFWLRLSHPAHPGGDIYPLSQVTHLFD
jgi:hypothetical protein